MPCHSKACQEGGRGRALGRDIDCCLEEGVITK